MVVMLCLLYVKWKFNENQILYYLKYSIDHNWTFHSFSMRSWKYVQCSGTVTKVTKRYNHYAAWVIWFNIAGIQIAILYKTSHIYYTISTYLYVHINLLHFMSACIMSTTRTINHIWKYLTNRRLFGFIA